MESLLLGPVLQFAVDFKRIWDVLGPKDRGDIVNVTVKCPCGHTWTYQQPRHYGGSAFAGVKRCPNCGKNK